MAIDIEERRRRRDERLGAQTAAGFPAETAPSNRAISREWAAVCALLVLAVALALSARYRHLTATSMATSGWAGIVMGGLLCNAALHEGRARLTNLALAIFAGLPLASLPFYFFPPDREVLPLLAVTGLGGAFFGAAIRWAWHLRETLGDNAAAMREGFERGAGGFVTWLHDAMLKAICALFIGALGAAAIYVSREQQQEVLFWAGMALLFLIGTVGMWAPGLFTRTRPIVGLRHVGQLCFWLCLLVVPFIEQGPSGNLPYSNKPSLRFAIMGLGLVVIGATWLLQKTAILSRRGQPEPKKAPERGLSLALVVVGLVVTLVGAQLFERGKLTVDQTVSETNLVGMVRGSPVRFQPVGEIVALEVGQPLEADLHWRGRQLTLALPFYVDEVKFQNGPSFRLIAMLYPGDQLHGDDHGLVKAIRAAAQLNVQSFPDRRTERWSK